MVIDQGFLEKTERTSSILTENTASEMKDEEKRKVKLEFSCH